MASSTSKPTIVIIPGSFSAAAMYYELVDMIKAQGYEVYVHSLPSASRNPPEKPASLEDDAVFFRNLISNLADQGKDIVVVPHSYGGIVATEAVKGVGREERSAKGQQGGVVRIVYLTAIVLAEGRSLDETEGPPPPEFVEVNKEPGYMRLVNLEIMAQGTFNDWPFEKALAMAKVMPRHSAVSFASPLTYAGYKYVPSSYIFCDMDLTIPPERQLKYINLIKESTGKEVDVRTLHTGHCPTVTAPEQVVNALVDIIEKAGSAAP